MSKDGFFFPEAVGILPINGNEEYRIPVEASIKLVQNGYELRYEGKEFVADSLEDALAMIKKWMEKFEKTEGRGKEEEQE